MSTTQDRPPKFATEQEEADWWFNNQKYIVEKFEQAEREGTLTRGSVARVAKEGVGASPTITIRLPQADLNRAKLQAEKQGLRYQTYLKMLLHRALDAEENAARR